MELQAIRLYSLIETMQTAKPIILQLYWTDGLVKVLQTEFRV